MPQDQVLPPDFFSNTGTTGREDYLRLHLNENPYGPPPGTVEAVSAEAAGHLNRYPDSECRELRQGLAAHFGVDPAMVAAGNGTDELVLLTSMTFLRQPGAAVAVTVNTFPGYLMSASSVGAAVRTVPLRDAAIPADGVAAAMDEGAALAFVCNPLNPTGAVLDRTSVARLIAAAEASGAVLVFDEAYMDFAGQEYEFALDAVRDGRRLLVMRTFSKAWGLASVRMGCVIGPEDLVGRVNTTAGALPFNVSRLAQRAVLRALQEPGHIERVRTDNARARDLLCKSLDALGVEHVPSVTNFVMAKVPGDSVRFAARLAAEHHIFVRNLDALGLPGHLRISIGTVPQVERLATALADLLERY